MRMPNGDEVVFNNPDEVLYLADSRMGPATMLGSLGEAMQVVSWELTTTPAPGEGELTQQTVMATVAQLLAVRAQIDYLLTPPK